MVSDLIVTSSSSLVIHLTLVPMRWYATDRGTALVVVAPGVKWKLNLNMEWRRSVCGNSHFHPVLLLWRGTGWVASGASERRLKLQAGVEMWWAHVTSHWDSINLSIGGSGSFWLLLSFRQQTEILCKREWSEWRTLVECSRRVIAWRYSECLQCHILWQRLGYFIASQQQQTNSVPVHLHL